MAAQSLGLECSRMMLRLKNGKTFTVSGGKNRVENL